MNCSICTASKARSTQHLCGHSVLLCPKCSDNFDYTNNCIECSYSIFSDIEKEIDIETQALKQKEKEEAEKKPKQSTAMTVAQTSATKTFDRHDRRHRVWTDTCNNDRCERCGLWFCDCLSRARTI